MQPGITRSQPAVCVYALHTCLSVLDVVVFEFTHTVKVFSCFRVISAEAHNTFLGILKQQFADLTANGVKVHCLGISCIAV